MHTPPTPLYSIIWLENDTLIPEEVLTDETSWEKRSSQEKEQIIGELHDQALGEDWDKADTWADVTFSDEEIKAFSSHILVQGDNGEPEWYTSTF